MTELVGLVSIGKGTWDYLKKLIECNEWSKVIIIGSKTDLDSFSVEKEVTKILIDPGQKMPDLVRSIKTQLSDKISDTEIALNLISGTGKEHMAVLSACLKSGVGIRLVAYSNGEFIEI